MYPNITCLKRYKAIMVQLSHEPFLYIATVRLTKAPERFWIPSEHSWAIDFYTYLNEGFPATCSLSQ